MDSKANEGNSSLPISYTFSIATAATAFMGIALFGLMGFFYKRRSKFYFIFVALGIAATLYACTKSSDVSHLENEDLFIRIVQVDKDGSKTYSKSVRAIR
ncbi:hypothetical protein [Niabella ginsengisoli]|uniref:Uncharacterized protein n=1 Tax=Niabella ginsengisoli TaxID=522298 RepID=A0ABS9SGL1_9BACT|nr:hypothetical protein [Niabella ginsengisoli]MCH5597456.1 hypothetical protein [Niabella ginsengisoli]